MEEVVVGLRPVLEDRVGNGRRRFPGFWENLEKCLGIFALEAENFTIFGTFVFIKMKKKCLYYSGWE